MKVFCILDAFLTLCVGVCACAWMGAEGRKVDAERPAGRLLGRSTGQTTGALSTAVLMGKDKSRCSQETCGTKSAQFKDRVEGKNKEEWGVKDCSGLLARTTRRLSLTDRRCWKSSCGRGTESAEPPSRQGRDRGLSFGRDEFGLPLRNWSKFRGGLSWRYKFVTLPTVETAQEENTERKEDQTRDSNIKANKKGNNST